MFIYACELCVEYSTVLKFNVPSVSPVYRMASARAKAEQALLASNKAQIDSERARTKAREYAPDFVQPGKTHAELFV